MLAWEVLETLLERPALVGLLEVALDGRELKLVLLLLLTPLCDGACACSAVLTSKGCNIII